MMGANQFQIGIGQEKKTFAPTRLRWRYHSNQYVSSLTLLSQGTEFLVLLLFSSKFPGISSKKDKNKPLLVRNFLLSNHNKLSLHCNMTLSYGCHLSLHSLLSAPPCLISHIIRHHHWVGPLEVLGTIHRKSTHYKLQIIEFGSKRALGE